MQTAEFRSFETRGTRIAKGCCDLMQDSAPRRGLKQMNAAKIHAAMVRVAKERCIPFWQTFRTIALNRGSVKVARTKETLPSGEQKEPSNIQPTQELLSLKETPKPAPPAVPEPAPAPAPKPTPSKTQPLLPPNTPVAVLTLDEHGQILTARDACAAVLGWDCATLPGQNVRDLLKGGLDNEVGQFLDRHRAGKNPAGTTSLHVTARRKDGTEFSALVTAVTWGWDTTVLVNGETARLTWTAAFRDLSEPKSPPVPVQQQNPKTVKLLPQFCTAPKPEPPPEKAPEVRTSDSLWDDQLEGAKPPAKPLVVEPPPTENSKRFDEDLAILRQERDELVAKLSSEQLAAGEMKYRLEELEKHLAKASHDLEHVKSELSQQFETELLKVRQERDELNGKMTSEQLVAAELNYRLQELQNQCGAAATDLEHVRGEVANREQAETELRGQLTTAQEAAYYMEIALKEEVSRREKLSERLQNLSNNLRQEQAERSKRFEQEMTTLRQERDELTAKFTTEQREATDSARRAEELESRLSRNAAEFERAKTELEKQFAERSAIREQLDTAVVAKKELEGANKRFEEELANLRREQDELHNKLVEEQKVAVESKERAKAVESRLGRNAADADRIKVELEKQEAERERTEAEWREQLDSVQALRARLELSLTEAKDRIKRLEIELSDLREERNDLKGQLVDGEEVVANSTRKADDLQTRLDKNVTELDQLKAALAKQTSERERAQTEWREQLEAAQALGTRLETALGEWRERNRRLEEEQTELRRERNDLKARLAVAQETAAEASRQITSLQGRLDENATELEQIKATLAKQTSERERVESKLREQQETAKTLARKLESDIADLREQRDELKSKLAAEHSTAIEWTERAEDLDRRLKRTNEQLEQAEAELEKHVREFKRSESEWRDQLDTASALAQKFEAAWTESVEQNQRLEEAMQAQPRAKKSKGRPSKSPKTPKPRQPIAIFRPKLNGKPAPAIHPPTEVKKNTEPNGNGHPLQINQYDFTR